MVRVEPDALELVAAQRARLAPDPRGDTDAAHVVDEPGPLDELSLGLRQAGLVGGRGCERRHSGRVPAQVGALHVREVGDRAQAHVDLAPLQHRPAARLGGEELVPDRRRVEQRQRLPRCPLEGGHHGGVEPPAGPGAHDLDGAFRSCRGVEVGVMRDLHHPHGQRDVVAPNPAREAPAVPALVQVREGLLDAEAEREPLGQHGADLAVAQGPVGQGLAHPRSPSQHLAGATQRLGVRVEVT